MAGRDGHSRSGKAITLLVGCALALSVIPVWQQHVRIVSNQYPDARTCDGDLIIDMLGWQFTDSVQTTVLREGEPHVERVPRYRARACFRDEYKQWQYTAQSEFRDDVQAAVVYSNAHIVFGLDEYLDDRYSSFSNSFERMPQDWARTLLAGAEGTVTALQDGGGLIDATKQGFEDAWDEKGQVYAEAETARLYGLLLQPNQDLQECMDSWFEPDGKHQQILEEHMARAVCRSLRLDCRDVVGHDATAFVSPGRSGANPGLDQARGSDNLAPAIADVVGIELAERLEETTAKQLGKEVVAGVGEGAAVGTGGMVVAVSFGKQAASLALKTGLKGSCFVLGEFISEMVETELDEILHRREVELKIEAEWDRAVQGWALKVQDQYSVESAEQRDDTERWFLNNLPNMQVVAW